jgi:hypothetical protein
VSSAAPDGSGAWSGWCAQYYFETIFPRIPKPVGNDISTKLQALGLPSKAVGNAGQGGGDRRGIEEGNRRPASVKVMAVLQGMYAVFAWWW